MDRMADNKDWQLAENCGASFLNQDRVESMPFVGGIREWESGLISAVNRKQEPQRILRIRIARMLQIKKTSS